MAPPPSLQAPFSSDNLKLVCELLSKLIAYFKVEFRDLKQQVLANVAEQRPEGGWLLRSLLIPYTFGRASTCVRQHPGPLQASTTKCRV